MTTIVKKVLNHLHDPELTCYLWQSINLRTEKEKQKKSVRLGIPLRPCKTRNRSSGIKRDPPRRTQPTRYRSRLWHKKSRRSLPGLLQSVKSGLRGKAKVLGSCGAYREGMRESTGGGGRRGIGSGDLKVSAWSVMLCGCGLDCIARLG